MSGTYFGVRAEFLDNGGAKAILLEQFERLGLSLKRVPVLIFKHLTIHACKLLPKSEVMEEYKGNLPEFVTRDFKAIRIVKQLVFELLFLHRRFGHFKSLFCFVAN